jgi:hypothetical protein
MTRNSEFTDKCSECGKYGVVRLKRIFKKKPHKTMNWRLQQGQEYSKPKPEFKTKTDFDLATETPYTTNVRVNRTEHPYRYMAVMDYLCGLKPSNSKRPVLINPPKPEPGPSKTTESLGHYIRSMLLVLKILPLVEQKYPYIGVISEENKQEIGHYLGIWIKLFNSATDDRYKRSLPEWALIIKEAEENSSYRAAARKYSGASPDGIEVRLSIRSIRKKKAEIQEFFETFNYYEYIFVIFANIVMKKVGRDRELLAIYEQHKREYDDDRSMPVNAEKEEKGSETGQVYVDPPEQNHCEESQGSDGDSSESYYEYFYNRHYDPELRKKQKLDRKRGIRTSKSCDGKVDHIVDEKTIRPDIVQKLRLRYRSSTIHATAVSLTPSRLAKIKLDDDNFSFYKRMIEVMNTNVYKCLEEEKQVEIWCDAHKMLVDMRWPKNTIWEKLFADLFESKLRRRYEKEGLKPDSPEFDKELDETLHTVFRSDGFRQMKLKPN